jgi:hypothetical protein
MSELGLAGPPAGPQGNPVVEGRSTAEVRWILPGQADAAVAAWFARFPGWIDSREDAYLIHPVLRELSVKIRAGRALEVKQYHGSPGMLLAAGRARGRIEYWRKWSFPFGPRGLDGTGPPSWTMVHKRRRMSRFRVAGGRLQADVPERAAEPACAVELTEIRSGGETWWSLGLEATGPAEWLRPMLLDTAVLIFAQVPHSEVELDMSHCQSYAEWLSRHRSMSGNSPVEAEVPRRARRTCSRAGGG